MYQFHNDTLCIPAAELYGKAEIITRHNYDRLTQRGGLRVVRRGCKGTPALVEFSSMKSWIKNAVINLYGDPGDKMVVHYFAEYIKPDAEAAHFFSRYKLEDGRLLPENIQREYRTNAELLDAIHRKVTSRRTKRKLLGNPVGDLWQNIVEGILLLDKDTYPHSLPSNRRRLREKYNRYQKEGYTALIHRNFNNNNSRKVTIQIERLLLSLYCQPNKPYVFDVHDDYFKFLGRAIDVVDVKTGELFDPEDYKDKKGNPISLSEATVWNYLRNPKNQILVDKYRERHLEFNGEHRPHHHRKKPQFSLSKISMDDRDLPRKMHDGNRVKAYYAYDVASGCIIGASYSKKKNKALFVNCMRDMFRFLDKKGYGIPMEVEVEHHLVNTYKNDLMKAGTVFPFVRWALAGNAQEKHAENFNRTKKYGYEKRYQQGIGRFSLQLKANRVHLDKLFDETNDKYKQKTYDFERLVGDDMFIINLYNNDLHPNQKRYKGMTRLEVLEYNLNPNLAEYDPALLAKYIGEKIDTTIRRSQYINALYAKYQLSSPAIMASLASNNYEVEAYYLPDKEVNTMYLYQNDTYLCEVQKIIPYNTAVAEWVEDDKQAIQQQREYIKEFDNQIKAGKQDLGKAKILRNINYHQELTPEILPTPTDQSQDTDFEDLIKNYNQKQAKKDAVKTL